MLLERVRRWAEAVFDRGITTRRLSQQLAAKLDLRDAALLDGWRDWSAAYMGQVSTTSPYDHCKVLIWRVEWPAPNHVDPRRLDPMMNVMGLLWKPADGPANGPL